MAKKSASKQLDGILELTSGQSYLYHIENLSDALKAYLRETLRTICHGEDIATNNHRTYSYRNTIKTFLSRYDPKEVETKKGMIGELLVHVILKFYRSEFKAASQFLNLEEGSIKKGFDVIFYDDKNKQIWITEVKSGAAPDESAKTKFSALIHTAKRDLVSRMGEANEAIWLNAIHGVRVTVRKKITKKIIEGYLEDCRAAAQENEASSTDRNAILTAVVYKDSSDKIDLTDVQRVHTVIENERKFKDLIVVSLQKETFQKVEDFIRSEAETESE